MYGDTHSRACRRTRESEVFRFAVQRLLVPVSVVVLVNIVSMVMHRRHHMAGIGTGRQRLNDTLVVAMFDEVFHGIVAVVMGRTELSGFASRAVISEWTPVVFGG